MNNFAKTVDILATARKKGIDLFIEEGRLRFKVAKGENVDTAFIELLKEHKDSLYDFLNSNGGSEAIFHAGEAAIQPVRETYRGRIPLSYSQERLWTIDRLRGSVGYHLYNSYRCNDQQEAESIAHALNEVVNRHEVLRTVIKEENGAPYQVILPRNTWAARNFQIEDVTEATLRERVEAEKYKPFDLATDHMVRAKLFRIKEKGYLMTILIHHIAADGWSKNIMINEILAIYQSRLTNSGLSLPALPLQYADYAIWQRQYLTGDLLQDRLAYWIKQLQGAAVLELPFRYPHVQATGNRGHALEFETDKALTAALHKLAKQEGATLFMLLLATFKVLLYRYSGQTDICLGSACANRTQKETEPLIGFFVNTLVLRSDLSGNPAFTSLLSQVRNTTLKAYEYQDVPFERIVDQLAPEREGGVNPLFQVMFDLQHSPGADMGNTEESQEDNIAQDEITKFDLAISISEREGRLRVRMKYGAGIFNTQALTTFAMHYKELLSAVANNPGMPLDDLNLLTAEEETRILTDFNNSTMSFPDTSTIPELFEEQVKRTPDNIALIAGAQQWTYTQLNEAADRLAVYLRDFRDIGHRDFVGLKLERDGWMIIAVLAILKAGATYVPVDMDNPPERVAYILEDSCCKIVIDKDELERYSKAVIAPGAKIHPAAGGADDLAYVIYTSGSTGKPKGVMVEHSNVINLIISQLGNFNFDDTECVLQFSNISFDPSVEQIFLALFSGSRLVILDKATRIDPERMADFIAYHKITHINMVPAMLKTLPIRHYPALRRVTVGGDSCPLALAEAWSRQYTFINQYGPTETTVFSTAYPFVEGIDNLAVVSVGRPLGNNYVYILDAAGRLVPPGIRGELYIGGKGVARGYLNRPDLTEQRFIPDPFRPGERMYKSGDLGKWLPDGNIAFLGRADDQVKLRGHRIELGEIEAVLRSHELVRDAVVAVKVDDSGQSRLLGYVIPSGEFDATAIREWLKTKLPDYMVPAFITALEKFPLSTNAKVDRKALPDVEISSQTTVSFEGPRNETEQMLARIWCELLKLPSVSVHENFFELGGDSITSIQMVSRLNRYGYTLHPHDIFDDQTIAKLAAKLREVKVSPSGAEQGLLGGRVGLLPIQRWFLELDYKKKSHFSQAQLFKLDKSIQAMWLSAVVDALVRQHDTLRLTYSHNEDGWYQYYGDVMPEVEVEDLSETAQTAFSDTLTGIFNHYRRSLDIHTGKLIKVVLVKTPSYEAANRLFIVIHHLAVDGVSWRILLQQFQEGITTIADGGTIDLGAKGNSYREWTKLLTRYATTEPVLSQLEYWKRVVAAYTPLPLGRPATPDVSEKRSHTVVLDKTLTASLLQEVNQAYHTEINDILLAALAYTFSSGTGHTQLVAGMEGHGREYINREINVSNTVGWFTTEYPMLLETAPDMDMEELVVSVKEQLRRIPQKGIGYGLLRYLHPDQEIRNTLSGGKWDIVFNYLGQVDNIIAESGRISHAAEYKGENFDPSYRGALLDITGVIKGGELVMHWGYAGPDTATVAWLAEHYIGHLRTIIAHCSAVKDKKLTPSDYGLAPEVSYHELTSFIRDTENEKGKIADIYRLSPLQEGMLFHHHYDGSSKAYLEQMSVDFPEGLDVDAFIRSWNHLIKEHTILRSSFIADTFDIPVQCVFEHAAIPCTVIDLLHLDETTRQQEVAGILRDDLAKGIDFSRAPLMRIILIKLAANYYKMVWTHHHIIVDGWSNAVLISEFMRAYTAYTEGQAPSVLKEDRYGDYIRYIGRSDKETARAFWKNYLSGLEDKTLLPFTGADTTVRNRSGARIAYQQLIVDHPQTEKIRQYCQEHQLTVNTFVQGVWSLLLSRYTGSNDTVFGAITSGRPADLENVEHRVGLYINNLPLRSTIKKDQTVKEWLTTIQKDHTAARDHQYVPLTEIQQWSGFNGDFYDSVLIFQNYPDYVERTNRQILKAGKKQLEERTNYLLTIMVGLHEELVFTFGYNSDLINWQYITNIKGHVENVISELLHRPEAHPGEINILSAQEQQQLLHDFNDTAVTYEHHTSIIGMFTDQVNSTPLQTAVICEGRKLSYQELQEKSDQLALYLQQHYGCNNQQLVGISMHAGEWLVISILAVLKTGAGYVPMDAALPEERIRFMLTDAGCHLLINEAFIRSFMEQPPVAGYVFPDVLSDVLAVIYTSGSTNMPKGVSLSHHNMINRLHWMWEKYPFAPKETTCFKTSISFVDHMWELFGPLLKGVPLVIFPKHVLIDLDRFISDLVAYKVSRIVLVTTLLKEILQHKDADKLTALKYWTCSGEVLPQKVITAFYDRYKTHTLLNIWGSTELMADATCYDITGKPDTAYAAALTGTVVGRPIANYKLYVLSDNGSLLPVGVIGQIGVSGAGVAMGYLNQPELTAKHFIPHPFEGEGMLFLTGDMGRMLPDGTLEITGRADTQVKIHGNRVELAEIENKLLQQQDLVQEALVCLKEWKNELVIVAYIIPGTAFQKDLLRERLARELPVYMLPTCFVEITTLPRTVSGKINRMALPDITENDMVKKQYTAPRNEKESALAAAWENVLGMKDVGIMDDFYELGGNSLRAMHVVAGLKQEGWLLSIVQLMEIPRIADLAAYMQPAGTAGTEKIAREKHLRAPLSPGQEVYFSRTDYIHATGLISLPLKPYDRDKWMSTVHEVYENMEVLRMQVLVDGKEVIQQPVQASAITPDITFIEKPGYNDKELKELLTAARSKPFDLANGMGMRIYVCEEEQQAVAFIIIHHVLTDDISNRLLRGYFEQLYYTGNAATTPDGNANYVFANAVQRLLSSDQGKQQLQRWSDMLQPVASSEHVFRLPDAYKNPISLPVGTHQLSVQKNAYKNIRQYCADAGVTVSSWMLSVIGLYQYLTYPQTTGLLIDIIADGREVPLDGFDAAQAVGQFSNIIPVYLSPEMAITFTTFLKRTHAAHLATRALQLIPGKIVRDTFYSTQGKDPGLHIAGLFNYREITDQPMPPEVAPAMAVRDGNSGYPVSIKCDAYANGVLLRVMTKGPCFNDITLLQRLLDLLSAPGFEDVAISALSGITLREPIY